MGEIRLFAFTYAPQGWMLCQGQLLTISQNQALFSLVGTIYGGDGVRTFGLPDMRGLAMKTPGGDITAWCIAIDGAYPSRG